MSYLSGSRDTRCRRVPQEEDQSEKRKKPKEKVKSVSVSEYVQEAINGAGL